MCIRDRAHSAGASCTSGLVRTWNELGFRRSELEAGPRNDPRRWPPELPWSALCAVARAEPDGDDEKCPLRPKSIWL
eukprot:12756792-Alexandrium_andersonii.AAC.1